MSICTRAGKKTVFVSAALRMGAAIFSERARTTSIAADLVPSSKVFY